MVAVRGIRVESVFAIAWIAQTLTPIAQSAGAFTATGEMSAPYAVAGTTAQATVTDEGEVSNGFSVLVAVSAPGVFTWNAAGWGQAAAVNADGTANTSSNPVKVGNSISICATGEGVTAPVEADGNTGGALNRPVLLVLLVGDRTSSPAVWISAVN